MVMRIIVIITVIQHINFIIVMSMYQVTFHTQIGSLTCFIRLGPQLEEDHRERENASAYKLSLISPLQFT